MIRHRSTIGLPSQSNQPKRAWTDKHVASHVAFLPSIYISLTKETPIFELPLLVFCVVILSISYHRQREPTGTLLSITENAFAKILYIYGCTQILHTKDLWLQCVYACFLLVTTATWLIGFMKHHKHWDRTHYIGLHIIPGIWCSFVAHFNQAILD